MSRSIKNTIKCCIFLIVLVISLININKILEAKYYIKNSRWPTTSTYKQFYNMDKESIDVIFLGSSVVVNAFIPQELYNDYGIRSYNLGSEQQSMFLSYYWLKEALRFQKPKVIVLDARFMWDVHPENAINTNESLTRKCLDPMKWSNVKMEAVHELCKLDKSQSELSYYLTNIRYHSRWSNVQEYDFDTKMGDSSELKGYGPILADGPTSYTTFEEEDTSVTTQFVPLMKEYLDKITSLCKSNDIELILIDLPGNKMNDGINNALKTYARESGIDYYNLCSTRYYNEIGATLPQENIVSHQNVWGAIKTSKYIGRLLQDKYGVEAVVDDQYESTKAYYEHVIDSMRVTQITSPVEYINALNKPGYAVFFAAHGDSSLTLSRVDVEKAMKELGLKCSFTEASDNSYIAVVLDGHVIEEESSDDAIEYVGSFRNRNTIYALQSSGKHLLAKSSVVIDGIEFSKGTTGLNVVVYDLMTDRVIDKVTLVGNVIKR